MIGPNPIRRFALVAFACLGASCGGEADYALPSAYEISFPSKEAAIETQAIQLYVVDATGREDRVCNELFVARATAVKFDRVLTQVRQGLCDAISGKTPLGVSFGARAFFVIGARLRDGTTTLEDYLYGCTVTLVGSDGAKPRISLAYAVPSAPAKATSTCPSVGELCAGHCQE